MHTVSQALWKMSQSETEFSCDSRKSKPRKLFRNVTDTAPLLSFHWGSQKISSFICESPGPGKPTVTRSQETRCRTSVCSETQTILLKLNWMRNCNSNHLPLEDLWLRHKSKLLSVKTKALGVVIPWGWVIYQAVPRTWSLLVFSTLSAGKYLKSRLWGQSTWWRLPGWVGMMVNLIHIHTGLEYVCWFCVFLYILKTVPLPKSLLKDFPEISFSCFHLSTFTLNHNIGAKVSSLTGKINQIHPLWGERLGLRHGLAGSEKRSQKVM